MNSYFVSRVVAEREEESLGPEKSAALSLVDGLLRLLGALLETLERGVERRPRDEGAHDALPALQFEPNNLREKRIRIIAYILSEGPLVLVPLIAHRR